MVRCSILGCNNNSKLFIPNLSFHSYPKHDVCTFKLWIEATGRTNWHPPKTSVICSVHFEKKHLAITNKTIRLHPGAIPTLAVHEGSVISNTTRKLNGMQNAAMSDYMMTPYDLEACRVCFDTDCTLYPMTQYKELDKAYKMLTGLSTKNDKVLPPYMCTECAHRLLNCIRFRARSLRAHLIMLEAIKDHGDVTPELIKSIVGEHGVGSKLSITHNEANHYNLEIDHDVQENTENDNDIKLENVMFTKNYEDTINNAIAYLPAMNEYSVEYNITNEDEVGNQGSLNYEYRMDHDTDDYVVIDEIKNDIEIITNNVPLYCPGMYESNVVKSFDDKINLEHTVNVIINNDNQPHNMISLNGDEEDNGTSQDKDEIMTDSPQIYVYFVPDLPEVMVVDDDKGPSSTIHSKASPVVRL